RGGAAGAMLAAFAVSSCAAAGTGTESVFLWKQQAVLAAALALPLLSWLLVSRIHLERPHVSGALARLDAVGSAGADLLWTVAVVGCAYSFFAALGESPLHHDALRDLL